MKRLFSGKFSFSALLVVLSGLTSLALNSCNPPTVGYQTQGFATMRVMNFAGYCTSPMDIFWDPVGQTPDNQAKIYNLNYGAGSWYATGLVTGQNGTTYHLAARRTRDTTGTLRMRDVTLMPGHKYTWLITRKDSTGDFQDMIIEDANTTSAATGDHAMVRFVNEMPGTNNLALYVNDPLSGQLLTDAGGVAFNAVGAYTPIPTAQDLGYTYFVIDVTTHSIIAKLANQTPVKGNYYTLVFAGDLCRTQLENPEDTVTDKQDTIRLRTFDDNLSGNDQTVPVPVSMRYNVINGIVDQPYAYGRWSVDSFYSMDNQVGFVFNTLTLPQRHNFTLNPVAPLSPAGSFVKHDIHELTSTGDTVYDVTYQNGELPTPLDIRGYATDGISDSTKHLLFDIHADALVGLTPKALASDRSYSFLFADSVAPPSKNNLQVYKGTIVPIPDIPYKNGVKLVFIPGIIKQKGPSNTNVFYSSFWFQAAGQGLDSSRINRSGSTLSGADLGRWDTSAAVLNVPAGTNIPITIMPVIGIASKLPAYPRIDVTPVTFTADAGGIYEIALIGTRNKPRVLIVRANP